MAKKKKKDSDKLTKDEVYDYIYNHFPQLTWALEDKELGPLLRKAAKKGWDISRLYGALIETEWWQETADSERVLTDLKENDPATYKALVDAKKATLATLSEGVGIPLSGKELRELAEESLIGGYDGNQDARAVRAYILKEHMPSLKDFQKGKVGGQLGSTFSELEQLANNYMVPLAKASLRRFTRRIVKGKSSAEAYEQWLQTVAAQQFPWLADQIKAGDNPADLLSPYQDWIAQELETAPDQIDLRKGKYQKLLYDQKEQRARSLGEITSQIRSTLPEWQYTNAAHQEVDQFASELLTRFGLIK